MRLPVLFFVVLCAVPSYAQPAPDAADAGPSALAGAADAGVAEQTLSRFQQWDALYAQREDAKVMAQLLTELDAALKTEPQSFEILWRAARAYFWIADDAQDAKRAELGVKVWELGDRATAASPRRAEGWYYAAVGIGVHSQGVGILKALTRGLEGKFNERIDKALMYNPDYQDGAPRLTKARYYYELPWPKRDLDRSQALLEKNLRKFPYNLRCSLYLAETLLAKGEAKQAKAVIDTLRSADTSYDPPEARRILKQSQATQAAIEKEL